MNDRSAQELEIVPLSRPPRATVRPPGSKSITNRALVLAGLHNRVPCVLRGALHSEDTEVMADGLNRLGIAVRPDWPSVRVERPAGERVIPAAAAARGDLTLRVEGELVSQPYVAMTVAMMRQWGLEVDCRGEREFRVPGRQSCAVAEYGVEPDASAASYFFGVAAVAGGEVTVE